MDSKPSECSNLYELRRLLMLGGAGASSVILIFLFGQYISHDTNFNEPSTIDEMMGYFEFFLFAVSSFFFAALLVWSQRKLFKKIGVPWVLIAAIGSVTSSVTFSIYVTLNHILNYGSHDPFMPLPPLLNVLLFVLFCSCFFFLISAPATALASSVYSKVDGDTGHLDLT